MKTLIHSNFNLIQFHGYLSRMQFAAAFAAILGISLIGTICLILVFFGRGQDLSLPNLIIAWNPSTLFMQTTWFIFVFGLFELAVLYMGFCAIFKRLRDIRGTIENQLGWQAALVTFMFSGMPVLFIGSFVFLFLKEGLLSSPNSALPLSKIIETFHESN